MTYFHMGNPHYHRRKVVSLSCSGWEGVGPTRYGRQTNCCRQSGNGIQDSVNPHTARRILEEVKGFDCCELQVAGNSGFHLNPVSRSLIPVT